MPGIWQAAPVSTIAEPGSSSAPSSCSRRCNVRKISSTRGRITPISMPRLICRRSGLSSSPRFGASISSRSSAPVEITPPADPKKGKGVVYTYANGVELIHGGKGGCTFFGPKGSIFVTRGKISSDPESILKEPLPSDAMRLYASPGHHQDFLDCIKTRKRPICDVEVGARSVTVCHLGNLAYWYGRKLRWDPEKWEFPGDAEANGWRTRERRKGYELPAI